MFVRLTSAGSQPEAQLLKGLLEAEEIPCVVNGESQSTTMGTEAGFAEIQVLVPEEHLERAKLLLTAEVQAEGPGGGAPTLEGAVCPVHEQQATATCSRCGTYVCAGCGALGDPPVCEECHDRATEGPDRRRRRMQIGAWTMLAVFLGGPTAIAALFWVLSRLFGRH